MPKTTTRISTPEVHFWGGRIQFFREWFSTDWDSDDLIDQAEIIEGLRFARLAEVLAYKRMLMRPKDIMDIHTIAKLIYGRPSRRDACAGSLRPATARGWSSRRLDTGHCEVGERR